MGERQTFAAGLMNKNGLNQLSHDYPCILQVVQMFGKLKTNLGTYPGRQTVLLFSSLTFFSKIFLCVIISTVCLIL